MKTQLQKAQSIRSQLLQVGQSLHLFNPETYDENGFVVGDSFDDELPLQPKQKVQYLELKRQRIDLQKQLRVARIELAKTSEAYDEKGLLVGENWEARHIKLLQNEQPFSFEIDGKIYTFEFPSLSYARFVTFQQLRVQAEVGFSAMDFCNQFAAIYERFANSKQSETILAIGQFHKEVIDFLTATQNYPHQQTELPYQICSLFFNTADEDRNSAADHLLTRKIEAFKKAADPKQKTLTYDFFLRVAFYCYKNYQVSPPKTTIHSLIQQLQPLTTF